MPVKVKCTNCGLELQAPDDLVGKHATCPQCRTKLSVGNGAPTQGTSVSMRALPQPPPAPGRAAVDVTHDEAEDYQEPPKNTSSRTKRSRESIGSVAPVPPAAVAASPLPQTASTQSARFIIADATARRMELGASGQLPHLVLDEAQKKEVPEEASGGSKTWILLAAVGASVLLSVGLLFFDATGGSLEPSDKGKARKDLERRYVQELATKEPRPPCQPFLARGLQAYNRGDYAEERRLYRHVLDMLHSEGKDPIKGITGAVNTQSNSMPNDIELEELLSTLLRE